MRGAILIPLSGLFMSAIIAPDLIDVAASQPHLSQAGSIIIRFVFTGSFVALWYGAANWLTKYRLRGFAKATYSGLLDGREVYITPLDEAGRKDVDRHLRGGGL